MRQVKIIEQLSLDGVIQAPGAPDEDRDGGFRHGGWAMRFQDPVVMEAIEGVHGAAFDLLLGRRTYDIWSGYWPTAGSGPLADRFNGATKYVATHRPESLGWGPAVALGPDLAAGVREIKAAAGPDLVVWGSSSVVASLLEQGLADELVLIVYPVLMGTGKRLVASDAAPCELELVESRAGKRGVVVNRFRPAAVPAPARP